MKSGKQILVSWASRWYSVVVLLLVYEAIGRLGLVSQRLLPSLVTISEQF